jgi:plastocyanin
LRRIDTQSQRPQHRAPERLKSVLGIANLTFIPGRGSLAVVDPTLSGLAPAFEAATHHSMNMKRNARRAVTLGPAEIGIDNFNFTPRTFTVATGTRVTWINNDDVPHLIVNVQQKLRQSSVLDTDQKFSATLTTPGTYDYFCSLHPKMQGRIIVTP